MNIGASELYSFSGSPMDYTQQVQRSAQLFADSGVELLLAYARNVTVGWPIWQLNESVYLKFAVPPCPVLILVGTLDANTENGLGFWFQKGECYLSEKICAASRHEISFAVTTPLALLRPLTPRPLLPGLGNMSTLLNVPYNSHVTIAIDDLCVDNIALQFFQSLGTKYDTSCLSEIQEPNWDGSSSAAQDYSMTVFGT